MNIDRDNFESYMERILEQIELLHKKTDKFMTDTGGKEVKIHTQRMWLWDNPWKG